MKLTGSSKWSDPAMDVLDLNKVNVLILKISPKASVALD